MIRNATRPLPYTIMLGLLSALIPISASAQMSGPGPIPPYPPETLTHELLLVLAGAVFGGFLGPILQAVDSSLGVTPGAKLQRRNYKVQREIAASLRQLVDAQTPVVTNKETTEAEALRDSEV